MSKRKLQENLFYSSINSDKQGCVTFHVGGKTEKKNALSWNIGSIALSVAQHLGLV